MILVTGATGLVGGNLLWYLLQENDRVTAIRRSTSDIKPLKTIFSFYTSIPDQYLSRIEWKTADILNPESLKEAMQEATIVYHCAATVSFGNNYDELLKTNVIGTKNIVRASIENNVKKLCFVSSITTCGKSTSNDFIVETDLWIDSPANSFYSKSKYYSEQEVWKGIKEGLNAVIVNPGVILGVSGTEKGSSQLFKQVQKGLTFYSNGGSGYVDVRDVVKAMLLLTQCNISAERFILVGENCSNKEILNWMADGFEKQRPFICLGKHFLQFLAGIFEFLGRTFHFHPQLNKRTAKTLYNREYYSNRKISDTLGIRFSPVKECIQEICEYQMRSKSTI